MSIRKARETCIPTELQKVRKVRSRLKKAHTVFEIRSERADRGQSSSASKLLKQGELEE
jgi:hypothetical protein